MALPSAKTLWEISCNNIGLVASSLSTDAKIPCQDGQTEKRAGMAGQTCWMQVFDASQRPSWSRGYGGRLDLLCAMLPNRRG
eukprot:289809-Rhodomonas_salina.1